MTWEGGLTLFKNFLSVLPQRRTNNKENVDINLEKLNLISLKLYIKKQMLFYGELSQAEN